MKEDSGSLFDIDRPKWCRAARSNPSDLYTWAMFRFSRRKKRAEQRETRGSLLIAWRLLSALTPSELAIYEAIMCLRTVKSKVLSHTARSSILCML